MILCPYFEIYEPLNLSFGYRSIRFSLICNHTIVCKFTCYDHSWSALSTKYKYYSIQLNLAVQSHRFRTRVITQFVYEAKPSVISFVALRFCTLIKIRLNPTSILDAILFRHIQSRLILNVATCETSLQEIGLCNFTT